MQNKELPPVPSIEWLALPLTPEEIEWKIQTSKNNKTLVVPYIDNRAVMDRLNKAVGWDNWESDFQPFADGFICRITLTLSDGRKLTKADGAGRSAVEPVKGGISDAMKRCAVQFGLGRSLYNYPKVYLEGEHRYIPNWGTTLLDRLVIGFNMSSLDKPVYILNEAQAQKPARQYDPGR
ncbi:Rad52/Rad22 family DNA repair protein [Fibrella sp. ES10-3-2-2]|nr:hypothetical protein A6C57_01340 [Fibrella sp. ES10-3-2-2]